MCFRCRPGRVKPTPAETATPTVASIPANWRWRKPSAGGLTVWRRRSKDHSARSTKSSRPAPTRGPTRLRSSSANSRFLTARMDADRETIRSQSCSRLPRNAVGVGLRDLCYVIYTSGSTGRPKGVMIEHRSACHLVCAEARLFSVRPVDRVYQGFSLAFDASVEEVWLAFYAGATLVAATPEMAHAGPDLSRLLAERGVTVLSCVPTLLSMLAEDVPTLRLLIFGGEACPEQLVERWARSGRRLVNTYGPTEATVIATYTDLFPGEPVTIGRA